MSRFFRFSLIFFITLSVITVQYSPTPLSKTGEAFAAAKTKSTVTRKTNRTPKKVQKTVAPGNNFKGAIVFNQATGKIIFDRRADVQIPPASLTKVLSMFVALDIMKAKKMPFSTRVKVSTKAAAKGGSRMGLRAGDTVTVEQLFLGMAISSGNDAATALAEFFGKTEAGFVVLMNQKARQIGMKRSTFKNASGLPAKGQFTTARDMLTLAKSYLAAYPGNLAKYHAFRTYTYKGQTSTNANPLLGRSQGADGLKTGYVNASGYNLIATSKRGGTRLIAVLLGAPTSAVRAQEIQALLEAGYGKKATMVPKKTSEKPSANKAPAQKKKAVTKSAPTQKKNAAVELAPVKKNQVKPQTTKKPTAQKPQSAAKKSVPKKQAASSKKTAGVKKATSSSKAKTSSK